MIDEQTGVIHDPARPWLGGNITGGDDRCFDKGVFDYLIDTFHPQAIMDIGCGEGYLMEYFDKRGIQVYGVEGFEENIERAIPSIKDNIVLHDYAEDGAAGALYVDMVISCEFVEHVHRAYMVNYLVQFLACRTLAFTHAWKGQQGHHHVNCEDDDYWITLMTSLGMTYLKEETKAARALVKESFWGSILIFKNDRYG